MKVAKIMARRPISLRESDDLGKVVRTLSQHNISGCPVVNGKNRVVGVVTQTDVVRMVNVYGKISRGWKLMSFVDSVLASRLEMKRLKTLRVSDFCTRKPVVIDHDSELYDTIRLMDTHDVERLPVVKNKRLVGIISKKDVVKALEKM